MNIENTIEEIQNKIIDTRILQDELEDELRELVEFRDSNEMFSASDRFIELWSECCTM